VQFQVDRHAFAATWTKMQHKFFAKKPQEIFQSRLSSVYTYSLSNIFFCPHPHP